MKLFVFSVSAVTCLQDGWIQLPDAFDCVGRDFRHGISGYQYPTLETCIQKCLDDRAAGDPQINSDCKAVTEHDGACYHKHSCPVVQDHTGNGIHHPYPTLKSACFWDACPEEYRNTTVMTSSGNENENTGSSSQTGEVKAHVLECNNPDDDTVRMKAGIENPTNDPAGGWTFSQENGMWVKTFDVNDMTKTFSQDNNWLYFTATQPTSDCKKITVAGVEVCQETGEDYTFTCKYSLADQDVSDTVSVTGQDTEVTAEGTGTLGYTLTVSPATQAIGDTVTFTITPTTADLVYATVKSCDVKFNGDAVTIFGHQTDKCFMELVGAQWTDTTTASSMGAISGSWTAFKWSTSTDSVDAENQEFQCTLGLSKDADSVQAAACA